jgi:hypothetical protein
VKKFKFNKENILNLTVGIVCIGGIIIYLTYISLSDPPKINNPCKTIAVYSYTNSSAKGFDAVFVYFVSGKQYNYFKSDQDYLFKGQKFNILYNKDNPSDARLIISEPVFTIDENIYKTIAIIKELKTEVFSKKPKLVVFNYIANGQKYETYQYSSDWNKYNVKVGDKCELEYLEDNPSICIIHLDKKIK